MPRFRDRDYAAFLFDMDGTMLDSGGVVDRAWRAWAARHGIDAEAVMAACHGVQGPDTIRRFAPAGVDVAAEARWLLEAELADMDGVVAIPGILDLVAGLGPRDWALVTSAPRPLAEQRLAAVGLPRPEVMVTAEDVRRGKPDPAGFLHAAELLGVEIGACLAFEDSAAGAAAVRAAGAALAIVGPRVAAREGEIALVDYR